METMAFSELCAHSIWFSVWSFHRSTLRDPLKAKEQNASCNRCVSCFIVFRKLFNRIKRGPRFWNNWRNCCCRELYSGYLSHWKGNWVSFAMFKPQCAEKVTILSTFTSQFAFHEDSHFLCVCAAVAYAQPEDNEDCPGYLTCEPGFFCDPHTHQRFPCPAGKYGDKPGTTEHWSQSQPPTNFNTYTTYFCQGYIPKSALVIAPPDTSAQLAASTRRSVVEATFIAHPV